MDPRGAWTIHKNPVNEGGRCHEPDRLKAVILWDGARLYFVIPPMIHLGSGLGEGCDPDEGSAEIHCLLFGAGCDVEVYPHT